MFSVSSINNSQESKKEQPGTSLQPVSPEASHSPAKRKIDDLINITTVKDGAFGAKEWNPLYTCAVYPCIIDRCNIFSLNIAVISGTIPQDYICKLSEDARTIQVSVTWPAFLSNSSQQVSTSFLKYQPSPKKYKKMDDIPYDTAVPLTKASLAFNTLKKDNTEEEENARLVSTAKFVLDDDIIVERKKLKTHTIVGKREDGSKDGAIIAFRFPIHEPKEEEESIHSSPEKDFN